jgi:hypothetical protein
MIAIYFRGSKKNKALLAEIEEFIYSGLKRFTSEINRVQIRPDEYEYRCTPKIKGVKILTVHLKMVNRSFIIQWLINFIIKDKERLFVGMKFGTSSSEDDPVYKFDVVPYRRKFFIRQRFETFVELDDIVSAKKRADQMYMLKSDSQSHVDHIVSNSDFVNLILRLEPYLEHLGMHKSAEPTDPHLSITYEFTSLEGTHVDLGFKLFFLVATLHLKNHESIKKIVTKGKQSKSLAERRGVAKRGGAKRKRKKRSKV